MRNNHKTSSGSDVLPAAAVSKEKRPLCLFFFLQGSCRNGNSCRFSHDSHGMTRQEALKTIPCTFFARRGGCKYGEYCELMHEEQCNDNAHHYHHQQQQHVNNEDDALLCGICLEDVNSLGRSFGLLSCCNHVFCYECLMEWRTEGSDEVASRRVCPTCRKPSDYVVPSPILASNNEEKQQILRNYKDRLATIPCRNFDGELGSCTFGKNCFYAHLDGSGKDIKSRDESMQELYEKRIGRRERRNRDRLAPDLDMLTEILLMMGLRRHLEGGRNIRPTDEEEDDDDDDDDDDVFDVLNEMNFMDLYEYVFSP